MPARPLPPPRPRLRRRRSRRVTLLQHHQLLFALFFGRNGGTETGARRGGAPRRTCARRLCRPGDGSFQRPFQGASGQAQPAHPLGRGTFWREFRAALACAGRAAGGAVRLGDRTTDASRLHFYTRADFVPGAYPGAGPGLRGAHGAERLPSGLRHRRLTAGGCCAPPARRRGQHAGRAAHRGAAGVGGDGHTFRRCYERVISGDGEDRARAAAPIRLATEQVLGGGEGRTARPRIFALAARVRYGDVGKWARCRQSCRFF